jgi:hypothetical protein
MAFPCAVCDRRFSSQQACEQHQRDAPMHNKSFRCETCSRNYGSEEALKQHQRDSPMHKDIFNCNLCNRNFGSQDALEQHKRESPMHKETFQCDICNRNFSSKQACEQHQRDSPKHKKIFLCGSCNCSFNNAEALASHKSNCSITQTSSTNHHLNSSLNQHDDEVSLSTALSKFSILDNLPILGLTPISANSASTVSTASTASTPLPRKKAKKKPTPKRPNETRELLTFPELHEQVAQAVLPEITSPWFHESPDSPSSLSPIHVYGTNLMGRFKCNNNACKKDGWVSGRIHVQIYGYEDNGYSAVVYNQRCTKCKCLGTLEGDKTTYVERVAYRIKAWAGVRVQAPPYSEKQTPPHEEELCEGCKRGMCERATEPVEY